MPFRRVFLLRHNHFTRETGRLAYHPPLWMTGRSFWANRVHNSVNMGEIYFSKISIHDVNLSTPPAYKGPTCPWPNDQLIVGRSGAEELHTRLTKTVPYGSLTSNSYFWKAILFLTEEVWRNQGVNRVPSILAWESLFDTEMAGLKKMQALQNWTPRGLTGTICLVMTSTKCKKLYRNNTLKGKIESVTCWIFDNRHNYLSHLLVHTLLYVEVYFGHTSEV